MNLDRRAFLAATSVAMMSATLPGAAEAKRKGFFARVNRPIGLQLYTLGDEPEKDLDGVFAKVAAIGYRDIELPGLYGREPAAIKAAADRAGLTLSCLHLNAVPLFGGKGPSLSDDPARIVDLLGALGIRQVVKPLMLIPAGFAPQSMATFPADLAKALSAAGADIWKQTADLLNDKAAMLKPHGISLGYHNHNVEFAPIGKTTGWEIIAKGTDPSLINFEVDIGWLAAAGIDPVQFLKRHSGRVHKLHVKDVRATTQTNFSLQMDPCEIGSGKLDWSRILPAAQKAGVRHFYVEQEAPFARPRMEAIAVSHGFLSKLVA